MSLIKSMVNNITDCPFSEQKDAIVYRGDGKPVTLIPSSFNREESLKLICDALEDECEAFVEKYNDKSKFYSSTFEDDLKNLSDTLLEAAVVCNAERANIKPDHETFKKIMARVLDLILSKKNMQLAELTKSNAQLYEEFHKSERRRQEQFSDLERRYQESCEREKREIDRLHDIVKNTESECINTILRARKDQEVELENAELLAKSVQREMNKKMQDLQEEKGMIIVRFEQQIEQIATNATQKHEQAMTAIIQLRTQISPLRRELSPLRRQVKTQEVALSEKDAEIERLKQALQGLQIQNSGNSK